MRLIATVLVALAILGADKEWQTGTVVSVDYEPQAPAGQYPGQKKGVRYVIQAGDQEIICYHISATVFSGYREDLFKPKESIKLRIQKKNVFALGPDSKEHRLDLFRSNIKPKP
jgi:hypothetical protein